MKSVKELTEKLKKLDIKNYDIRGCCNKHLTSYDDYEITVKSHGIDEDFIIKICFYEDGIALKLKDLKWYRSYPYVKVFNKETYSKKEEAELVTVLEEIIEHSDATLLNKFNCYLK